MSGQTITRFVICKTLDGCDLGGSYAALTARSDEQTWRCGRCGEPVGGVLEALVVVKTNSGHLIVGDDQGVHRCDTLDRVEELEALRVAQKELLEHHGREQAAS